ncbi:hypothetical protein [Paenibacillus sp.]|jgi:hypothetical protein|uniref:hypothetical protein n=1 Tax=Paenibacillus sp. TaxID=58172 RepID=UPI002833A5BA|nr:hypothetical protein [Paenibacillus sp.]MDR0267809.1 hypothetical protein [Paenibacillus sp.]
MIICTTATLSHMPFVLELSHSVRRFFPSVKMVLGLVEAEVPESLRSSPWVDEVILAKDLSIPGFDQFIFKLTEPMSKNTIKAQLMNQLIKHDAEADVVVYVDCYSKFLSGIPEALSLLDHHSIVLTPHLIDANYSDSYERELMLLNDGSFFAGFVALKRDDEAKDFLSWWSDKLNRDIRDPYGSDFFDQKWLNFVNVFFNAAILRHPGYQLGFWNFHENSREAIAVKDHEIELKGGPLRLINFGNENNMFEHYSGLLPEAQRQNINRLKQHYDESVNSNGQFQDTEWSYGRYHSGEIITSNARQIFRVLPTDEAPSNPFEWSDQKFTDMQKGDGDE